MSYAFPAKYKSTCPSCSEVIEVGDQVVPVDGVVVHEACGPFAIREMQSKAPAVCDKCYQTVAPNGACGCYED